MNLTKIHTGFHRDTRAAIAVVVDETNRAKSRWYLNPYASLLLQFVGFGCSLVSFHMAGAMAATSVLFALYCGLGMAYRTRQYARLPRLSETPEDFRFFATMAWKRRAIGLRLMTVAFSNLCAGMGFVTLIHYLQGANVGAVPMGWVTLVSTFANVGLRQLFSNAFLVGPLLKRLDVATPSAAVSKG